MPIYTAKIRKEIELAAPEGGYSFDIIGAIDIEAPNYNEALKLAKDRIERQPQHQTAILEDLVLAQSQQHLKIS